MGTDVAFVLDSSGSIGAHNWDIVKSYVRNVTATVGVEGDQRVAIITYGNVASVITDFTNDQDSLTKLINDLRFLDQATNTADGVCQLLSLNWRDNILRIAIVMTDGKSNRE